MKKLLPLVLACSFSVTQIAHAAPATSPKVAAKPKIDPAAVALLEKSAKAYTALGGLSMEFDVIEKSGQRGSNYSGKIAFSRPDRAKAQYKRSDGAKKIVAEQGIMIQKGEGKRHRKVYLLEYSAIETVVEQIPNSASLVLGPLAAGKNPLTMGYDFVFGLQVEWQSARVLPDNSVQMTMKATDKSPEVELRLFFDKNDKLLRRVEGNATIEGQHDFDIITFSNLRLNPKFGPNEFKYTPAAGEISDVLKPFYDPRIKVGGETFPLNGADLAKYRGKVLLLEFRGANLQPFPTGTPSIKRMYQKYHSKGFEVLSIHYHEKQAQIDQWAKAAKIAWPQIFELQNAPQSNTRRYGIQRGFLEILVGRDGKITAINPRTRNLEGEVVKALGVR